MARPRPGTLEHLSDAAPDQLVLVEHGTDRTRTRGELDERAGSLAVALAAEHGIGHGSRVALQADGASLEVLETVYALAKLGAVPVPIPTAVREEELAAALRGTDAALLLSEVTVGAGGLHLATDVERLVRSAAGGARPLSGFRTAPVNVLASAGTPTRFAQRADDRTDHAALATVAGDLLTRARHRPSRGHLLAAPVWLPSTLLHANVTLLAGGPLVLLPEFDGRRWLDALGEHEPGTAVLTPSMVAEILELDPAVLEAADTTSLDAAIVAGDHLPLPHRLAAADLLGEDAVAPLYGTFESGPIAVLHPEEVTADPGTAGRPLQGVTVEVRAEDGNAARRGTRGILHVRSPLATDGAAVPGDHGHRDEEGRLVVLGRDATDWTSEEGRPIGTLAVEDVLMAAADVAAAVVRVGTDGRPHARVEPRDGGSADVAALADRVRETLGADAVPSALEVVPALPRDRLGRPVRG